jgi:hypothetical protein
LSVNQAPEDSFDGIYASTLCGLEWRRPDEDQWVAILPNPSDPEIPFKLQPFGLNGFLAHTAYPTPDAALLAAFSQGYTEPAPGVLDQLALSAGWRAVYSSK